MKLVLEIDVNKIISQGSNIIWMFRMIYWATNAKFFM